MQAFADTKGEFGLGEPAWWLLVLLRWSATTRGFHP